MTCDLDRLATWIAAGDDDDVRDHVGACTACAREADALRDLEERLEHLPMPSAPARRPWWPMIAAAALLAITAAVFLAPAIIFTPAAQDPVRADFDEIPRLFRELAQSENPSDAALRERVASFRRRLDALQRRAPKDEQIPVLRKTCAIVDMLFARDIKPFESQFSADEWKEIAAVHGGDPSPAAIADLVEAWFRRAREALKALNVPPATLADVAGHLKTAKSFRVRFEAAVAVEGGDPLVTKGESLWIDGELHVRYTQSGGVERRAKRAGGKTLVWNAEAAEWLTPVEAGGDPTQGIADPSPLLDALAKFAAKADGERFATTLTGEDLARFAVEGTKADWTKSTATVNVHAPFEQIASISVKGTLAAERKAAFEATLVIDQVGTAKKP